MFTLLLAKKEAAGEVFDDETKKELTAAYAEVLAQLRAKEEPACGS